MGDNLRKIQNFDKSTKRTAVSIIRIVFLLSLSYILIYPVIYMISTSIKSTADFVDPTVVWIPKSGSFKNFKYAFDVLDYGKSVFNTFKYEIVSALIESIACAFYGYALARFKMKLKPIMIVLLVVTILVPDIMVIVPRLANFKQLDILGLLGLFNKLTGIDLRPNIVDTPFTFILPSIFGVGLKGGLMIFIYMQFMKGLPGELEEAACLDGANALQTFIMIILPSSGVVILTVTIFSLIWHWNDYLLAMMYTSESRPLAVVLHDIEQFMYIRLGIASNADTTYYGVPMAACLLFLLPPLVMYMFLQKKFVQSIDRIGIVG